MPAVGKSQHRRVLASTIPRYALNPSNEVTTLDLFDATLYESELALMNPKSIWKRDPALRRLVSDVGPRRGRTA